MSIISDMKNEVKKSGASKSKFIYFRQNEKLRVRFLTDMEDGLKIFFHDNWDKKITVPCQESLGRTCDFCEDEDMRTRAFYAFSVYNVDANEVQIFMFPVNNCTPLPSLIAMYENYGTIVDRDYVITVNGKGTSKSYSVIPQDKVKFRNTKAKPFSEKAILTMIDKAYPVDEDEEDVPKKKSKVSKQKQDEQDYEDMTAKELYALCIERGIDIKQKLKADEYIDVLVDYDADNGDWDDEEDYSKMSAKDLYNLCIDRDIDVEPKKSQKFYIKELEDYDKAQEDWGEKDEGDDWDDEEDEWEDE